LVKVVAIASNALESFKNDAKKMVVALVDMERAFVPPQHFIRLVQRRMERQRREDELKNRSSKKTQEAEQPTRQRGRHRISNPVELRARTQGTHARPAAGGTATRRAETSGPRQSRSTLGTPALRKTVLRQRELEAQKK
jgi:hypothetical protein